MSDEKYFQRVKWQYMILDEAQAIKSSSSNRWKTLLGFNCRNRLLLTGTPVQNSMQELWALLTSSCLALRLSRTSFSEWFSKDIESHAEQKGTLNEHQLRRLHMILKPFMLRRIKKNVQNELGDKIEIDVFCDLSARQKMLYRGLRENVSVAELMNRASSNDEAGLKSLMNLVMQFRKVCNHPELFERADVRALSPLPTLLVPLQWCVAKARYSRFRLHHVDDRIAVPKLMVREGGLFNVPATTAAKVSTLATFRTCSTFGARRTSTESLQHERSPFASLPLIGVSSSDAEKLSIALASSRSWQLQPRSVVGAHRGFCSDDSFAAASVRPVAKMLRPMPTNSGRAPSLLMPLEEVTADYRRHSYLAKDSARAVVAPAIAPPSDFIVTMDPSCRLRSASLAIRKFLRRSSVCRQKDASLSSELSVAA